MFSFLDVSSGENQDNLNEEGMGMDNADLTEQEEGSMSTDEMMNNDAVTEREHVLERELECGLDNNWNNDCDDDLDTGTDVLVDYDKMVGDDGMMTERKNDSVIGD